MSRDRDFLAAAGQVDIEEYPQIPRLEKEAQARIDRKRAHDAKRKDRGRKVVDEWFLAHPCSDCGNADTRVLEADHVVWTRRFTIAESLWKPVEQIEAELKKCESRCANCHRIRHATDRQQSRELS